MSLLSVLTTKDFISFMTDGRTMKGEEIFQEDYQKFRVIGNSICIGTTGSFGHGREIMDITEELQADGESLESIVDILFKVIRTSIPHQEHPQINLQVGVGGINSQGDICVYVFSNKDTVKPVAVIPNNDETIKVISGNLNPEEAYRELDEIIRKYGGLSAVNSKLIQKELNDYVALKDRTVNTTTFHHLIQKERLQ
jgi:hypothetical protein